ncbi:glutathione-dependent disulfide-bond oxidoreductase [Shewanella sp. AS16]|uniref:glutathione-dependent disulfide-bond oxidoreductase n=1 Tax=Shewanella sp. AS16 TaxID=2907625 RepID=UPI001F1FED7D|nr:glutathione-dependent disulfide-bond oxidoreductase [Shewanella sp. AS16]MCE9687343.1 glutathione-dependent disulfide-bond oxidoreductase [Shewanella sp. AS16]
MINSYLPPKVWMMENENGGQWANINRPVSGPRFEKPLPVGEHPLQLYSMGTPNGQKVTIMLEELLALGIREAEYDAFLIAIGNGDQFGSGFVAINPNSKIPVMVDRSVEQPVNLFESGNILFYLAEKFGHFLPTDLPGRINALNWLFWLQGAAPFLGGGLGHFYVFAPEKLKYPINRFAMEVKRHLDLLDKQLAINKFITGEQYSIADIAIWPWYGNLVLGNIFNATEFLDVQQYQHLLRWADFIAQRPAVKRGRIVNRIQGEEWERIRERHSASDIDNALSKYPK